MCETVCLWGSVILSLMQMNWGGLERVFSCWVGVSLGGESQTKMCFQDFASCLMEGVYVEECEGIF